MSDNHFLKRRWKTIVNIVTFVALGLLAYLLREQIGTTIDNFGKVNTWALLAIIPIQFLNYDAYARMYRSFFKILGNHVSYKDMYKVSLELNFINHILPSGGVSGFSYFSLRLRRFGVSSGKATLVQTMKFIFLFISFQLLLLLGLLMLALDGQASGLTILVAGSLATLLVILTIGLAFIIGSKRRINSFFTFITEVINAIIHKVRPNHPETINIKRVHGFLTDLHENYLLLKSDYKSLKWPLFNALIANTTEILCVYMFYIAFREFVNPGAVIIAYAVANFAGLISVLPGGIGIYEALMTAVLATAGVSPAISIPVTVMYRVFSTTIQILPGYYFYHRAIQEQPDAKPKT